MPTAGPDAGGASLVRQGAVSPFARQVFVEHMLCARRCSRRWACSGQQTPHAPALAELTF